MDSRVRGNDLVTNLQLFVACVVIWGSTWLAITFQLGRVAPEASVFYRFLLASFLLFGFCAMRGLRLLYTRREHLWMALQGILMFGPGYVFVYYAEQHVVSGLVAVGFSASPLLGMLGLRLCFGTPMTRRMIAGSLMGIVGITLVFWPEFQRLGLGSRVVIGATYTVLAVVTSAMGSLVAHRNYDAGLPVWQTMAWGMLYAAVSVLLITVVMGQPFTFEATIPYVASLLYLTVFGSIAAFACYLTLLRRIGAAKSGYIGVMVPIVALVVSGFFEGFQWHVLTLIGIAISVAGNVLVLRR
jgi:drug/metabolite transporter (DMT)-like permease